MSSLPLAEVRRRFFDGDDVPENSVPQPILHSWRRCLGLGLPAGRLRQPERLDPNTLQQRQQASADWLQLAKPAIDALFDSVVDDGHVVIVADADGVILNQMGHPAFLDRAERVALLPGMDWREDVRGTNAIGTALVTGNAVLDTTAPGTSGAARHGLTAALTRSASARRSLSLARLAPMELSLSEFWMGAGWLRKRSTGSGMRGCGMASNADTVCTGSRTRSSMATFSSVMRLTKLLLAPFSSRRRTRYGSRSSCEPTGA